MQEDKGSEKMKKMIWLILIFLIVMILGACNSEDQVEGQAQVDEQVFTESDIEKVEKMVKFLDGKMMDFEKEINNMVQEGTIQTGDNEKFTEEVRTLGHELVIVPFLEEYPGSLVARDSGEIALTFKTTSSEPCGFGNCEFDGINVLKVDYNFDSREVYESENFDGTQLTFTDIKMKYGEQSDEEFESAELSFVKSVDDELVFTKSPYTHIETIDFQQYDKELTSIPNKVPESEVEAEQAEYKAEVEETLSKFPELQ